MPLNVTFDSNVYRQVVRPDDFLDDPELDSIRTLNTLLRNQSIKGFLVETIATLEGIRCNDRATYFSTLRMQKKVSSSVLPDGLKQSFVYGPDDGAHPGLPPILEAWLQHALALGFRFMLYPRIGIPRPPCLLDQFFRDGINDPDGKVLLDRLFKVGRAIEDRGVGIKLVKTLGTSLAQSCGGTGLNWHKGLGLAKNKRDMRRVADAVAEWADGDAVAAHIGYRNDFFCTRDAGKSAGISVLAPINRTWLVFEYGVQFVTPAELVKQIGS